MTQTLNGYLPADSDPRETAPVEHAAPPLREGDVLQTSRVRLDNGLRLWCKPRPGTGTVTLMLQIPVGSRNETKQTTASALPGAHGVHRHRPLDESEVIEVIRRRGGELNARTGVEDTVFHLHLKADDLGLGLDWLAEVMFRPTSRRKSSTKSAT